MGHSDEYNYESFSFTLDNLGIQSWRELAPGLGEVAPDFALEDLEGRSVRLSELRGRPVVLEFGSYTCPIFDGWIPDMDWLAAEYPEPPSSSSMCARRIRVRSPALIVTCPPSGQPLAGWSPRSASGAGC